MLQEFLISKRAELIERCRAKVASRTTRNAPRSDMQFGIPLVIDQLVRTLAADRASACRESREISGTAGGSPVGSTEIGAAAERYGVEMLQHGFTIDQLVHCYGDLCQAVSDLAIKENMPIEVEEFRTLNRCLDTAIADAVNAFSAQRDFKMADGGLPAMNQWVGISALELRGLVQTATLALAALKAGGVGVAGATGAILDRTLESLRLLLDRSAAEVRESSGQAAASQAAVDRLDDVPGLTQLKI